VLAHSLTLIKRRMTCLDEDTHEMRNDRNFEKPKNIAARPTGTDDFKSDAKKRKRIETKSDSDSDSDDEDDKEVNEMLANAAKMKKMGNKKVATGASPFFSSQPKKSSDGSQHWYSDAEILAVLDRRLRGQIDAKKVLVFGCAAQENVMNAINERLNEQRRSEAKGEPAPRVFLIGVNLHGNHWSALSVNFKDGFDRRPVIHYADPAELGMNPDIRNELQNNFGAATELISSQHVYQHNGYDCGPWVIEILESIGKTGKFPAANLVDIKKRRAEDSLLFPEEKGNRPGMDLT
jgi:hypothetical protein